MRVLIAEDQLLLRQGLIAILTAAGMEVPATVETGDAILPAVAEHDVDLVLLDIRMPPTHTDEGLRAAVALRAERANRPVLLLSQYVEQLYVDELLSSGEGGIGYLLKDRVFDSERFVEDLRTVAAGGTVIDPQVVQSLLQRRKHESVLERLSTREREALALMAQGRSNAAIAEQMVITQKAVNNLVNSILSKLDLPPEDGTARRVMAVLTYLRG